MNLTTFKTLVLREYWENKSFLRVPVIVASTIAISFLIGVISSQSIEFSMGGQHSISLSQGFQMMGEKELERAVEIFQAFPYALLVPLALVLFFVLIFYVLGSLYNERRDRSVLFWKSMPVSDTETVLSKVFSAFLVAPTITAIVAYALQIIALTLATILVWIEGGSAWSLIWSESQLFSLFFNNFLFLFAGAFWLAPILGWLWLVSAFAKRGAFLIALFAPLGIMLVEGLIFRTGHFGELIGNHFAAFGDVLENFAEHRTVLPTFLELRMWLGIVICGGFVASAIYIRRYRDDSY